MLALCFVMRFLVSFLFSNHLAEEERAGCFTLIGLSLSVFLVSSSLWSVVCECDISWSYSISRDY